MEGAVHDLNLGRLALTIALLLVVVVASGILELGLEAQLVIAATRCAVQLTVLCAFLLEPMFAAHNPTLIFVYLSVITVLAAREASARLQYVYTGIRAHFVIAFLIGSGGVLMFAVAVILQLEPWYDARYLVPIAGMLLGNNLTATALGADTFLTDLADSTDRVYICLCRGASWREAILPSVKAAVSKALTPTLNSMAVMGLVFIPGMMTGQLLGGQSPLEAGTYQILIMYLITVSGCLSSTAVVAMAAYAVIDTPNHALRRERIVKPVKGPKRDVLIALIYGIVDLFFAAYNYLRTLITARSADERRALLGVPSAAVAPDEEIGVGHNFIAKFSGSSNSQGPPLLEANDLIVGQTGLLISLKMTQGARVSITGATGSGKTSLLRVLCRLNAPAGGVLRLDSIPSKKVHAATWRSRIVFVSQDRPTLTGTPAEFFKCATLYRAQRSRGITFSEDAPVSIANNWGLSAEKFHQQWFSLSGGEAQRANLAIALALKPDVILLDEPTSALDATTTAAVEKDILSAGITLLLVTHSNEQASRLCTTHVKLVPSNKSNAQPGQPLLIGGD